MKEALSNVIKQLNTESGDLDIHGTNEEDQTADDDFSI
jgi:hypothetical protein